MDIPLPGEVDSPPTTSNNNSPARNLSQAEHIPLPGEEITSGDAKEEYDINQEEIVR